MKSCKECEFNGYSRQLCMVHTRSCTMHPELEDKELPPSVKIGAKALVGAGVGIATVILGFTAVSLVGGVALVHGALFKLGAGAGLAGGGVGFLKGVTQTKEKPENSRTCDESIGGKNKLNLA